MKIAVIGASAGVGLETVHTALARGYQVTTLSRSTETLPAHDNVTIVQGSATSTEDLERATRDADAVIVTLGTKKLGPTTLFSDSATALAQVMAGRDAPVIVVSGFGAGDSAQFQNPVMRAFMKALLGRVYADKARMDAILTATPLRWEIVHPGTLSNADGGGQVTGITSFHKGMKIPGISRKNLAGFLVDEAEQQRYVGTFVLPAVRN